MLRERDKNPDGGRIGWYACENTQKWRKCTCGMYFNDNAAVKISAAIAILVSNFEGRLFVSECHLCTMH